MSAKNQGAQVLGLGVAACAACCAGPVLGFLAAAGMFTVAGVALFGAVGLLALVPVVAWFLRRRRSTNTCGVPDEGPVPVELGRRL